MDLTLIEEVVKLSMVTLAILLALNLYLRSKILNLLRESHEEIWKGLGSPSLVQNNSFENGVATLRFIWGRGHRRPNDPSLDRLIRTERMLHVIQGVVLLLALLLMAAALFLR
jgi:hypothetical protein